jgi:hypothetical protein
MVIEVRRKLVLELNTVNLTYGVWKVMRISPADPYYLCCVLYQWSLKCQPRQPSTSEYVFGFAVRAMGERRRERNSVSALRLETRVTL